MLENYRYCYSTRFVVSALEAEKLGTKLDDACAQWLTVDAFSEAEIWDRLPVGSKERRMRNLFSNVCSSINNGRYFLSISMAA